MDHRLEVAVFRRGSCDNLACGCNQNEVSAKMGKLPTSDSWLLPPIKPDPNRLGNYPCLKLLLPLSASDKHMVAAANGACSKCKYMIHVLIKDYSS